MAGDTLYIGGLFEKMITKMDSQIAKVDQQIVELTNLKNISAQQVKDVTITKSSNDAKLLFTAPTSIVNVYPYTKYKSVEIYANGTLNVHIKGTCQSNYSGSLIGYLGYKLNGGTVTVLKVFSKADGTYPIISFDDLIPLSVAKGDKIEFLFETSMSSGKTFRIDFAENGFTLAYDLVDIANQSGIVIN